MAFRFTFLFSLFLSLTTLLMAQTIPSPTQTGTIIVNPNGNGKAEPGERIRYTVPISNTHVSTPATGVQLNVVPDAKTTVVGGSFRTSPLAMPDAYDCLGNVGITVPDGASDLLANDYDDNPVGLNATPRTNVATTQGGSITIAADGSFSYNPPRGFTGTDTYTYTLNDSNDADGAGPIPSSDMATVTFTVSGMVWFINNNAGACASSCDGRMSNPYTSLAAFNAANDGVGLNPKDNHIIFVYESATAYTGGIVLRNGQKLIGQDATVTLASAAGLTVPTFSNALPTTNSASPLATITNAAGVGVAVAMNNTLRGFTVGNTPAANAGISGNGIGTLTVSEVSVNGTGQILSLNDGVLNATFGALSTTSTTQTAIVLSNLSGNIADTDAANSSISGASGVFSITGSTSTTIGVTFNGDVTHAGANPLVIAQNHNTGTVTFQNGTLGSTGGSINFTNSDGTYNFNGTTTLSGGPRITIDGGSSGTFNFNSNTTVTNPVNIAFDLNGSNATVDYNGTLSSNTAFRLIDIANNTGGSARFDGNLTFTGNATGIRAQQNTGGTYSFNASSKSFSTGANTAVNLVTNTGATINFTGGGLVITTSGGTGFNATGGGTVTVQGTGNTISSGTGTALNVANTTIGASNMTFQSISHNGGTNGIVLNTTGSSGGLTVTGTGSANSGGTIQNCTGDGINLNSTAKFSLSYMNITANDGDGIGGSTVNGFKLDNCSITSNGDNEVADESGIRLTELTGSAFAGANPTGLTNCTIQNNFEFQIVIENTSGVLTDFQMNNLTVSNTGASGVIGNLVTFVAYGTATMTLNTVGGTYTGAAPLTATGIHADHSGTDGLVTANISNASFINNNVAVSVSNAIGGNLAFDVNGNTATGNRSHGLNLFIAANAIGSVNGKFRNNTVGTLGTTGSGSSLAYGIRVQNEGSTSTANPVNVLIDNNTIQEMADFAGINVNLGIASQAFTRDAQLTITNNTIKEVDNSRGIIVQQNNSTAPGTVCANISGNEFTNVAGNIGDGTTIRLRQLAGGTFKVPQASAAAIQAANPCLAGACPASPGQISIGGTVTFSQPACTLPTN